MKQKNNISSENLTSVEKQKFSFWKTFAYIFIVLLILLIIFFGLIGSFEDSFVDSFIGIFVFSLILTIILTFIIKWWKDYKSTGKIVDSEEKKESDNFLTSLFKWKMDEEELKNQLENYDTLGFFRSARKVATAFMIFSAVITLIFTMIGWFPSETWIDIVLVLILIFFVYKGQKWAIIVTMIYWTFSKGFQLVSSFSAEDYSFNNIIMSVIWWAIIMGAFWQAYQVEGKRKKQSKISSEYPRFCRNCGSQLDENSKYCAKCGAKTILVE